MCALLIDLHCHTNCSDGSLSPAEVVECAHRVGISTLAITDHDTIEGYALARDAARRLSLPLLCGVEVSTHLEGCSRSVHLLGYFSGEPEPVFSRWLLDLQESRRQRNAALLVRLQALGIAIEWSDVCKPGQRQVGRPHFAAALLRKGNVCSLKEAFDVYLGEEGKAWVERDEPSLAEALERIRAGGGVASLAHPVRISRDWSMVERTIAEYAARGLGAVECFHTEHSPEDTERLVELAGKYGLAETGGSDFHGAAKPDVQLGTGKDGKLIVPARVMDQLATKLHATGARASFDEKEEVRCAEQHLPSAEVWPPPAGEP